MFPEQSFSDNIPAKRAMISLGLIQKYLPWENLIERAKTIQKLYTEEKCLALKRVKLILFAIECNLSQSHYDKNPIAAKPLQEVCFLPVMQRPNSYPPFCSWKGQDEVLACGSQLLAYSDSETIQSLAGSQSLILNKLDPSKGGCGTIPRSVQTVLGMSSQVEIGVVVKQFEHLIQTFESSTVCGSSQGAIMKSIERICRNIYGHFNSKIEEQKSHAQQLSQVESALTVFHEQACIWVGSTFVKTSFVAKSWRHNGPYLFVCPIHYLNASTLLGY